MEFSKSKDQIASSWTKELNATLKGTSHHAAVPYSAKSDESGRTFDYIVVFGGWDKKDLSKDIALFSLRDHEWRYYEIISEDPIRPRKSHTMCVDALGRIVVFGGQTQLGVTNELASIEISVFPDGDVKSVHWKQIKDFTGRESNGPYRAEHTAHMQDNVLFTFGGCDRLSEVSSQVWTFSFETLQWMLCPTKGTHPEARKNHSSVLCDAKMYVFGGHVQELVKSVYMLDLRKQQWKKIMCKGTIPNLGLNMTAQEIQGQVYLFGGAIPNSEVHSFSLGNNTFDKLETYGDIPSSRHAQASCCWKQKLFIVGGADNTKLFSDTYILNLENIQASGKNALLKYSQEDTAEGFKIFSKPFPLNEIFLDTTFADVIFEAQGQEFPCHKVVLATRCKFFHNLFTSGMADAKAAKIKIEDMGASTFKVLLEFLYASNSTLVSVDTAFELHRAADKYMIPDLKVECERVLRRALSADNFVKIIKFAEANQSEQLINSVLEFSSRNFNTLVNREDFNELSKPFMVELLKKAYKS